MTPKTDLEIILSKLISREVKTHRPIDSKHIPIYLETLEDGTRLYSVSGLVVKVKPSEVVDDHGNVVNLQESYKGYPCRTWYNKRDIYTL